LAAGLSGNESGLLYRNRNQLKVVMRGLDPRNHVLAAVASACGDDGDGRIKSGHDNFELRDNRCTKSTRIGNFPEQPSALAGVRGFQRLAFDRRFRGGGFAHCGKGGTPMGFGLLAAASLLQASPAAAHGFGQRYDLPLPLLLYLFGAAAAVVVSFIIVGVFVGGGGSRASFDRRFDLTSRLIGRVMLHPALGLAAQLIALAVFMVTAVAGFIGNQDPYRNIAPTMVWIIFWVGLAYVSAFIGDLWALANPWRTIFAAVEHTSRRLANRSRLRYPEALGVWPACLLLLAFSWIELVYPSPAQPRHIAWFAAAYSLLTWAGMALFGTEVWLQRGEVFTLVFGTLARFAPTEISRREHVCALRPFGSGLLADGQASASMTAFVLLLLSTVLYDGLLGTPQWAAAEGAAVDLLGRGDGFALVIRSIGLVGFWLLFLAVFIAVAAVMSRFAGGGCEALEMARHLASTLVPIIIGYHLAHYLLLLLVQGQYVVPLISDPFGFGWDLFGTAGYRVDIGIVGARFAWYTAVAAILLGHIAAVGLAHLKMMRLLPRRGIALRAEIPLTALMVAYTILSLSIIAEPIVERREVAQGSPAALIVPQDAVIPEPGTGRLVAVGSGKEARLKLTYRLLGSAFHDGTKMTAADLLYAYMFAWRWSGPGESYDPAVAAATAPMRGALAGVRLVGSDKTSKSFRVGDFTVTRELFIVDVYLNLPPGDAQQDAAVAPPWSTVPWHLLALMEEAVLRDWTAFSADEAQRRRVEWLDLARSPALNARLLRLVEDFADTGWRPETLNGLVSVEEARQRWTALAAFFKEHGHFLVTNGPYRLAGWSADGASLKAFRDMSYPLGVGSFDAYAIPRRGWITAIDRNGDRLELSADVETVTRFGRNYRLERRPPQSLEPDELKRAAPECRYVIFDADGQAVHADTVLPGADHRFAINLGGALSPGRYTLAAEIVVGSNAINAAIRRYDFAVR
jgi:hypothetical protein